MSNLKRDGHPSFYISEDGLVCTHRMSGSDIPVWCNSSDDTLQAMKRIDGTYCVRINEELLTYASEDLHEWFAKTSISQLEIAYFIMSRFYNAAKEHGNSKHIDMLKPYIDSAKKILDKRLPGWDIPF